MKPLIQKTDATKRTGKRPGKKTILFILLFFLFCLTAAGTIYLGDYYRADETAMAVLTAPTDGITILEHKNDRITFTPEEPIAGLIFYPGGKVQYEAYAPLMEACAEQSILCVLLHMPFNLAVLDANAADAVIGDYPEITDWYIGGHSLGGTMAASYAAGHSDDLRGLILLAAYPTKDLDNSGLKVLSVYGLEDGVLNMDSYTAAKDYFPDDTAEYLIEGGNHAYFGSYGDQKGDGTAGIGNAEQISQTAALVSEFMIAG